MKGERIMGRGKAWSEEEEEYLKEQWGKALTSDIARELGRSAASVNQKAHKMRLGLPKSKKMKSVPKAPLVENLPRNYFFNCDSKSSEKVESCFGACPEANECSLTRRRWSEEEKDYLKDKWGKSSIPNIAKNLGRSVFAVREQARKMGLGAHLDGGANITYNQFRKTAGFTSYNYAKNRLIANGFPVHKQKCNNCSFLMVNIEEFWRWAEKHKEMIDFSRIEKNAFGKEPEWVDVARKASFYDLTKNIKSKWSKGDDFKLETMLKKGCYTYKELSRELNRSEAAIKRRIWDLALDDYPPVRTEKRWWTDEEVEKLLEMKAAGFGWEQIGDRLGRTGMSCRGKWEWLKKLK
ncbi:MAG: SANT/Myb domain-containing protein [Eubacterium sp.]|nr:SANT/Myb domain-containing protein [Eubacterium sp.]